jgi:hypothetical protein
MHNRLRLFEEISDQLQVLRPIGRKQLLHVAPDRVEGFLFPRSRLCGELHHDLATVAWVMLAEKVAHSLHSVDHASDRTRGKAELLGELTSGHSPVARHDFHGRKVTAPQAELSCRRII